MELIKSGKVENYDEESEEFDYDSPLDLKKVSSFGSKGKDRGLVIKLNDKTEFKITIVQSK